MKTLVNIKVDKEVKEAAQQAAKELGLPLSTIMNAYLKEFVRERSVHFSAGYCMSPKLERYLGAVENDIKHNRNLAGPFTTGAEMDAYLDS